MASDDDSTPIAKAVGQMRAKTHRLRTLRNAGFPLAPPTVPGGVTVPPKPKKTGADFDTDWARKTPARYARALLVEGPLKAAVNVVASPEIFGLDRLRDLRDRDEPGPVIFAPNHHSHLDAPLMLTSVPEPWRHHLAVAAAADYFFNNRVAGSASALALGAFPIDRSKVSRRSADFSAQLIREGWSIVIFPEGGRSPDGWGQPFRGGAGFLSIRTGAPVIPVHLEGTGVVFGKGMSRPKPGSTKVTFGSPLYPTADDDARSFSSRIEAAVAALGDEARTDWYTARRHAAEGTTPTLTGPDAISWRRHWELTEQRRANAKRRRQKRTWPKLD